MMKNGKKKKKKKNKNKNGMIHGMKAIGPMVKTGMMAFGTQKNCITSSTAQGGGGSFRIGNL